MTKYNQDADFEFFLGQRGELLKEHAGKIVLIHRCEAVDFFDTLVEAVKQGDERYGSERYIAQTVEPEATSELTLVSLAI